MSLNSHVYWDTLYLKARLNLSRDLCSRSGSELGFGCGFDSGYGSGDESGLDSDLVRSGTLFHVQKNPGHFLCKDLDSGNQMKV